MYSTMRFIFLLLSLSSVILKVHSYNILVICTSPPASHHNLAESAATLLHDKGHTITFVSPLSPSNKNFTSTIVIPDILKTSMARQYNFTMKHQSLTTTIGKFYNSLFTKTAQLLSQMIRYTLDKPEIVKLRNDVNQKFDLILIDYFYNEVLFGLAVEFDCPIVLISSKSPMVAVTLLTNNPLSPATNPSTLSSYTTNMNFMERLKNSLLIGLEGMVTLFVINPAYEKLYQEYFPREAKKVSYFDLKKKISLTLINYHPILGNTRLLYSNTEYVGGYHVLTGKPLSQDLKNIIDAAPNGIVFFSLGSNLKTANMDTDVINIIINSLSKVNMTFLWKYEEDLKDLPDNIIIRKWLPQQSILAHPNTKLFISHAGLLSTIEAAHFGVPIVACPIFGDQFYNSRQIVDRGTGLSVDMKNNFTETLFVKIIRDVLENEKFTKKAKEFQSMFLDRPVTPQNLLVHSIEHVIRSKGADYLRPPEIGLFQEMLLDVFFLIFLVIVIITFVISFIVYVFYKTLRKFVTSKPKFKTS